MVKSITLVFVIVFSIIGGAALAAQDGTVSGDSVEDRFLEYDNPETQARAISEILDTNDRNQYFMALGVISNMVADGAFPSGDETVDSMLIDIVGYLAVTGVNNRIVEDGVIINDFPIMRRDAVRLLGEIGSEETQRILINCATNEQEPIVLGEILLALTKNQMTDVQIARVQSTIRNFGINRQDNYFADSALRAIAQLTETDPEVMNRHPGLITEISRMARSDGLSYSAPVRARARGMLESILGVEG